MLECIEGIKFGDPRSNGIPGKGNFSMFQRVAILLLGVFAIQSSAPSRAGAQLSGKKVKDSIRFAQRYLLANQNANGTWTFGGQFPVGTTAMTTMALIYSGLDADEPAVGRGLSYLRSIPRERLLDSCERSTYELSLMTMALAVADNPQDRARMAYLVHLLVEGQRGRGMNVGSWGYGLDDGDTYADNSNCQFALLALREAVHYGIPVERSVWEKARAHWIQAQTGDGGWSYMSGGGQGSYGSMTVAGISSLVIIQSMLGDSNDDDCCKPRKPDAAEIALNKGIGWLSRHFDVGHNPGAGGGNLMYYLYGLERAGRLSGRRFFGPKNDWYREGAEYLIVRQHREGSFGGAGGLEGDRILTTSYALLFLSKGNTPVVVSKLKFGPLVKGDVPEDVWNRHPGDVHRVMEYITQRPGWPKLLSWQVVEVPKLTEETALSVLTQSPILYLSSEQEPQFTPEQVRWLRTALDEGGTLFASADCGSVAFEKGFHDLVGRLYPESTTLFKKLEPEHPVFKSEFLLAPEAHEFWGVDFGCRTPVIFIPEDVGCYWSRWSRFDPPGRRPATKQRIEEAMKVAANVIAYVTGRQPPSKIDSEDQAAQKGRQNEIERGFLEIAKLRHDGGWDTAPLALRNLLSALNRQVGTVATTKQKDFVASDERILDYPLLYMHGRQPFAFGEPERKQLREYLQNGGVLFADACCGSTQFDAAFRREMQKLFPNDKLTRIPVEHEMFTSRIGFDVREVRRRLPDVKGAGQPLDAMVQKGEPYLEGIEIDGRLAVIYSRYDISCALEKQVSLVCNGYVPEDALKLAINIVRYSQLE